jgi:exonuclease III
MRVVSWNIDGGAAGWADVLAFDADVALLQEARIPPAELREQVLPPVDPSDWVTVGPEVRRWRAAILPLNDSVEVEHLPTAPPGATWGALGQSRAGSWTAATVRAEDAEPITVVSVYAAWERDVDGYGPIWADASAHRILSDLSPLLSRRNHRLLIAGDLNLLYGYGEHGNVASKRRSQTVFDRAEALGLTYLGPRVPGGGRQPEPWPAELPPDSPTVPTYFTRAQGPAGATRQLDHVFASSSIAHLISVRALNDVADWGPSDHCRILIELGTDHRAAT